MISDTKSGLHDFRIKGAAIFGAVFAIYHFYTGYFGMPGLWLHRAIHACGILIYIYMRTGWLPKEKGYRKNFTPFFNAVALPLLAFSLYHVMIDPSAAQLRQGAPSFADKFVTTVFIVCIIEAARRLLGITLSLIGIVLLAYIFYGQYIQGPLHHPAFSNRVIVTNLFNTMRGLFGSPVGVASTYIIMFVIFGAFLEMSGGSDFFSELAGAASKGKIGGPAKMAVLASGFMGMINGSPVANVAGTGVFTIPLMKKNGYSPEFAGGVEAAASVGGMILPPIMGASVFLMSEITGVPYWEICIRAAFCAVLYYVVVYLSVHIEAIRKGLKPMADGSTRPIGAILLSGIHYLTSLVILVGAMIWGFSPTRCALLATISLVVLSWFKKATRMGPRKILKAFASSTDSCMVVSVACCVAGIVVAAVTVTGLGIKLSSFVSAIAGDSLFLALLVTAIASMLLGMGVNAVASYIVIAILLAPVLNKIGLNLFVAHFFCYFFSMTAGLTPPVATVSFTAAGIAGADQTKTALNGLMLGITGFVIPFAFCYNPGILLYGGVFDIVFSIVSVTAGVIMITFGFRNWMFVSLQVWERAVIFISSILMILPEYTTSVAGMLLSAAITAYMIARKNKAAAASPAQPKHTFAETATLTGERNDGSAEVFSE